MNQIRQIQELNRKELEAGISPDASWHADYRDTAYIYIGGLPFELSEGDILTIFSQFGDPTYINLVRDKETGKSRGFAFLKYEDQRSTDLAVDNLTGTVVMGRTLRVDHTRYKKKDDEPDEGMDLTQETMNEPADGDESEEEPVRPLLKEERELAALIRDHDDDDPMKAFLVEEKRNEVFQALALSKDSKRSEKHHKIKDRRQRSHRPRNDESRAGRGHRVHADGDDPSHRSRRHTGERHGRRSRSRSRSSDRPRKQRSYDEREIRRHQTLKEG